MPRRIRDLVATTAALLILFGILVSLSPQIRERATQFAGNSQEWSAPATAVTDAVTRAGGMLRDYASDNTYLFSLLVVAVVLLGMMTRMKT